MVFFDDCRLVARFPLFGDIHLVFEGIDVISGFFPGLSKSELAQLLEFLGLMVDLSSIPVWPPQASALW